MLHSAPLAAQPDAPWQAALSVRDWDAAARLLDEALAADPARADLWYRLAVVRALQGNTPGCVDAFETAADLDPTLPGLDGRLQRAQARAAWEEAHALDPPGYFDDLVLRRAGGAQAAAHGWWASVQRVRWMGAGQADVPLEADWARARGEGERAFPLALASLQDDPLDPLAWERALHAALLAGETPTADRLLRAWVALDGPAERVDVFRRALARRTSGPENPHE
jgi:tetratricopeptide (TPR) repeat protein